MSRALLAVVALLAAPAVAHARAGDIQRSFGTRGTQTLNVRKADAVGGAIVSGTAGTAKAKAEALEARGVRVGRTPTEVAEVAAEIAGSLRTA